MKLSWRSNRGGAVAETASHEYRVMETVDGRYHLAFDGDEIGWFGTLGAAKKAAQKHYDQL